MYLTVLRICDIIFGEKRIPALEMDMSRFEMHVHTAECDTYAFVKASDIVRMYRDAGYDGMVVTDHYFSLFFKWFEKELDGLDHRGIIDRWLRGYCNAREEGEKLGFTVLLGAEVRFDGCINDYLIYGLEPEFLYGAPFLNRLKNVKELIEILPKDTCVVQAHPFRNKMTVEDPSPLFGIEVHNGGTEPFRNEMAKMYAEHYGKAMLSGSDFHKAEHLARGGIITETEIKTSTDLVSVLKCGNYTLI